MGCPRNFVGAFCWWLFTPYRSRITTWGLLANLCTDFHDMITMDPNITNRGNFEPSFILGITYSDILDILWHTCSIRLGTERNRNFRPVPDRQCYPEPIPKPVLVPNILTGKTASTEFNVPNKQGVKVKRMTEKQGPGVD